MKRIKKFIVLGLSHVLFFLGGLALGAFVVQYTHDSQERAGAFVDGYSIAMMTARYSVMADLLRAEGDVEGYREVLKMLLSLPEQPDSPDNPFYIEHDLTFRRMVVYTRLSILEAAAGNGEEAKRYMELAMSACNERNSKDCTAEGLAWFVSEIDERTSLIGKSR